MPAEEEKNSKEIRILDAAQGLFSRFGLKKTSIEEIARTAGLGKGTIYLYFRSKEEIFEGVCKRFSQALTEKLREEVSLVSGHSEKLQKYILTRLHFTFDVIKSNGLTLEIFDEATCTPSMVRVRDQFGSQQIAFLKQIIDEGVAAGEFATSDSEVSSMAIFVAMDCLAKPWIFQGRELDLEDKVQALIELYLKGLMKRMG